MVLAILAICAVLVLLGVPAENAAQEVRSKRTKD